MSIGFWVSTIIVIAVLIWLYSELTTTERCLQKGHLPTGKYRRGYIRPSLKDRAQGVVAWTVRQEWEGCRRCGATISRLVTVGRRRVHGLSLSGEHMDAFHEEGEVWVEGDEYTRMEESQ